MSQKRKLAGVATHLGQGMTEGAQLHHGESSFQQVARTTALLSLG